jgi:uncharacterized protein (DUF362 family)
MKLQRRYPCHQEKSQHGISRRDFLKFTGITAAGLLTAGCTPKVSVPEAIINEPAVIKAQVAVGKAISYNPDEVENAVAKLIDLVGGLGDVVKSGDSVAIKVNLTGGTSSGTVYGVSAEESFITHPEVVRALIKQVKAAGAGEVFIVEAAYEWESYTQWGYETLAEDLGITLVDLNKTDPFNKYDEVSLANNLIYPSFIFNKILSQVDVFMSVSKMKNHYEAGVTHTMKNLFGLVPYEFYRLSQQDRYRSGFHGPATETRKRIPRVINDLNRARPIHFSLVDGIKTTEAGEGPWINTITPIQPGLLVAGKNPVSTDAVATALMGYDPTSDFPDEPFIRGENHLNVAYTLGLGTNRLDEIEVFGEEIEKVKVKFTPCR